MVCGMTVSSVTGTNVERARSAKRHASTPSQGGALARPSAAATPSVSAEMARESSEASSSKHTSAPRKNAQSPNVSNNSARCLEKSSSSRAAPPRPVRGASPSKPSSSVRRHCRTEVRASLANNGAKRACSRRFAPSSPSFARRPQDLARWYQKRSGTWATPLEGWSVHKRTKSTMTSWFTSIADAMRGMYASAISTNKRQRPSATSSSSAKVAASKRGRNAMTRGATTATRGMFRSSRQS
mmetsp:Transcript_28311/g.95321  ORF Transcript_28311/g.95321 Transcript_28311/m.95321 type:complete len:241 (-) Transcript_28311:1001-1723(-)